MKTKGQKKLVLSIFLFYALLPSGLLYSDAKPELEELSTVDFVDLKRYLGSWYEISRLPNYFQRKCVSNTVARYEPMENGEIRVINECKKEDQTLSTSKGKAWVVDKKSNSKLKVQFFWPFSGNYWIIDLGANYEYAVVGEPDRKLLWILSRTKKLPAELYAGLLERLRQKGYALDTLKLTQQD